MARKIDFNKRLNKNDTSKFCNRLWGLMQDRGMEHPNTLAVALCKDGYLSTDSETARKAITNHLNTENIENAKPKLQADYIIAYSKFFGCSTDYLLMEIGKENFELEYVEKKYGLDKNTLNALSNLKGLQNIFKDSSNAKYRLINLVLNEEPLKDSNNFKISSFIETLVAYMEFNVNNNTFYKCTKKGISTTPFKESANGKIYCNPLALNFSLKDIKVMHHQKIIDAVEELKIKYQATFNQIDVRQ